jgi:outer membrane assembly lipoprotein YfiO
VVVAGALLGLYGCGASVIPDIHSEPERYAVAQRLARQGELSSAIELLKTYIDRNAGAADVDGAIYLLGECYLRQKEWPSAQLEFERLLRDYPESDSSGSASFEMGVALFGQSRGPDFDQEFTEKALAQWREYLANFPGHWRRAEAEQQVRVARERLARKYLDTADLYVKQKYATAARRYYQRVMDDYSDLPLVGSAEIGMARCDVLEGKKELALQRLARIEAEHPGQPAAEVARRERARVLKMKVKAPARPSAHPIPDANP